MNLASRTNKGSGLSRVAALSLLFGVVTIVAGGSVLFGDDAARRLAGDVVAFVLWFNFVAGFLYILAAAGLWRGSAWALRLSGLIALLNLAVLVALAIHIAGGGAYELRTVLAMGFRTLVWTAIYFYARRFFTSSPGMPG